MFLARSLRGGREAPHYNRETFVPICFLVSLDSCRSQSWPIDEAIIQVVIVADVFLDQLLRQSTSTSPGGARVSLVISTYA